MNLRIATLIVGVITIVFGLVGLGFPEFAMKHLLGFAVDPSHSVNAVLNEVRATYGGLIAVIGVYTLLGALEPAAYRAQLLFIGLMWLGACAGRLVGVSVSGDPGLPGWAAVVFELIMGGALLAAALLKPRSPAVATASAQITPSKS